MTAAWDRPGGISLSGQADDASDEKITFHVGLTNDIVSPNPFKACCSAEYEMMLLNYNMLFGFKREDLTPVPELAEECTPSSDAMTYTCAIRDDAMWHDGEPLTSKDIAFTYRFILDNELSVFTDYLPYEPTFETPDDTTLIWKSTEPTFAPTLPPYIPIIPEHIWAPLDGKPGKEIKGFENVPAVGSGPFQLVEWEPDQFFRMEARPGHFFGTPTIDEVVYQIFQNKEAEAQALRAGQIDFAYDLSPHPVQDASGGGQHHHPPRLTELLHELRVELRGTRPRCLRTIRRSTTSPSDRRWPTRPTSRRSWTSSGRVPPSPAIRS